MFQEYFDPIPELNELSNYHLGANLEAYTSEFPSLDDKAIALFGINDTPSNTASTAVRAQLYKLVSVPMLTGKIADLGNIRGGETSADLRIALEEVCTTLLQREVIPVFIGNSNDLSLSLYRAFEGQIEHIEVSYLSSKLPLLDGEVLDSIVSHQPNHLFRLNPMGFQGHFLPPRALDVVQNLNFGHLRLGALTKNVEEAELLLRNTHLSIFHLNAIKQSDAPGTLDPSPTGIDANTMCQLAWYAGVSDTAKAFAILGLETELDYREQTSKLTAQTIWYFLDGVANRKNDHPNLHDEFLHYRCGLNSQQSDLLFHKSKRTNRWWMEVVHPRSKNNINRNLIIPCSYEDYLTATKGDLPARYLNAIQMLQ